jgi:hypothetical protein
MKKSILIIFTLFSALYVKAQSEFKMSPEGFSSRIEIEVPGKTSAQLHDLAKSWVLDKHEITIAEDKGSVLTFEGTVDELIAINAMGRMPQKTQYTVQMTFTDSGYTFLLSSIKYYHQPSGTWIDPKLESAKSFYNKKGELKSQYKFYPEIVTYFNNLHNDFSQYVKSRQ